MNFSIMVKYFCVLLVFLFVFPSSFAFSVRKPKTPSVESRIINGQAATPGQFPYQVGVQAKVEGIEPLRWSGGSLLSNKYVLTAAHSVQINRVQYIEVHLGTLELKNDNEPRKIITVHPDGFIVHEEYDAAVVLNDIALLRLPEVVEFTDKIQPISLPTRANAKLDLEDKYILATGWGRISDANYDPSSVLLYVEMQVLNQKVCNHFYSTILPSMICTSTAVGKGTCNGDSGGPLVYTDPDTKRSFQAGIVSFGGYTCVEDGWPAVHTRVTSYLDWIAKNTDIVIL